MTTWLTFLQVATQPRSFANDCQLACDTYSSTHLISPEVQITKRISDTGEHCGTPASTGCLSSTLPLIIMPTILSDRKLSVYCIRSTSICLTFIKLTSVTFATFGQAALMSIESRPLWNGGARRQRNHHHALLRLLWLSKRYLWERPVQTWGGYDDT